MLKGNVYTMHAQQLRSCSVQRADVFGSRLKAHRHSCRQSSMRMAARADSVLIINTKGGGHAFLGLHLARRLLKDGHTVSIFNDGEEVINKVLLTTRPGRWISSTDRVACVHWRVAVMHVRNDLPLLVLPHLSVLHRCPMCSTCALCTVMR